MVRRDFSRQDEQVFGWWKGVGPPIFPSKENPVTPLSCPLPRFLKNLQCPLPKILVPDLMFTDSCWLEAIYVFQFFRRNKAVTTILAIIDKKNKETNEKRVTLVRTEESAEAVIQGCSVK